MVSTWRFWSGKEITLTGRHPFQVLVLIGAVVCLVILFHQYLLVVLAFGYMFSGLLARAAYSWQMRHRHRPAVAAEPQSEPSHPGEL
jgi:CDP-diacylglycerol--serine O-phosphatidyltransferase